MNQQLLNAIRTFTDVPESEAAKLAAIVSAGTLKKGDHFIREGVVPTRFAFNAKGLFRYYYINAKGSEFTKGFFPENSFITAYSAMIRNKPSYYAIQALEDAEIAVIDYRQWQSLYDGHPCWKHFVFALLEKGYLKKEARERELLLLNAEERYINFLKEYPQLEPRIKQHLIASYLGITPVALSRIRRSMSLT